MTERRMLEEISAWLSFNTSRPASELKKMKNDIDQLLETAHNSDYATALKIVNEYKSQQFWCDSVDSVVCYLKERLNQQS